MNTQDLLKTLQTSRCNKIKTSLNELVAMGGMFGNGLMILKEIIH